MDNGTYISVLTSPAGSNTYIQYNNSGVLGGVSTFTYASGSDTVTLTNLLATKVQVGDTSTYITEDGSGNLTFTDANAGSKTLTSLIGGATNYWSTVTGGINYAGKVGVNTPTSLTDTLTVNGTISATNFNSSYFQYSVTNNNLFLGPNAGTQETGTNKLYIANSNTISPLIYGEFNNQLLKFYASTYIGTGYSLNFTTASVNISNSTGNNLTFQDAVANSGSPVTLASLMNGTYNALKSDFTAYSSVTGITAAEISLWNHVQTGGSTSLFLNQAGTYTAPSGGGGSMTWPGGTAGTIPSNGSTTSWGTNYAISGTNTTLLSTNGNGSSLTGITASQVSAEPVITAGTSSQYWRGDKTWQTLPIYTLSGLGGQPLNSNLTSISGIGYSSTSFLKMTGTNTFTLDTNTYLTTSAASSTYLTQTNAASTYQPIITLTTTGTSGASTLIGSTLNIPNYTSSGGSMSWPSSAGIANYSGSSSWGTSYTTSGTGTVVALKTSPVFVTPTLGVATATSINGVSLSTTSGTGSLIITNGASITLNGTGTLNIGSGGTLGTNAYTSTSYQPLATAYNTSNANLSTVSWNVNYLTAAHAIQTNTYFISEYNSQAGYSFYDRTDSSTSYILYGTSDVLSIYATGSTNNNILSIPLDTSSSVQFNQSINIPSSYNYKIGGVNLSAANVGAASTSHHSTHITGGSDPIPVFTSSSTGLVPASGSYGSSYYLNGAGGWSTPSAFTSTTSGIVPASGGSTNNFLRADGTWTTPSSGNKIIYSNYTLYYSTTGSVAGFTYILPANTLLNNGDILVIDFGGNITNSSYPYDIYITINDTYFGFYDVFASVGGGWQSRYTITKISNTSIFILGSLIFSGNTSDNIDSFTMTSNINTTSTNTFTVNIQSTNAVGYISMNLAYFEYKPY